MTALPTWTRPPRNTLELLKRMRRLVKQGWCQGAEARRRNGAPVFSVSPDAYQVCLVGARSRARVTTADEFPRLAVLFDLPLGAATYNDAEGRTQGEVVALLDDAITRLEEAR